MTNQTNNRPGQGSQQGGGQQDRNRQQQQQGDPNRPRKDDKHPSQPARREPGIEDKDQDKRGRDM